jgi:CRISPR system Cascade subunit CasA
MQVAGLREADLALSDINRIVLERSEGNTKLLFDHGRGGPLTAAQAARALVGHLQFVPGGLVKALRTSGSRGSASSLLMVAPVGQTLRETFSLSLLAQSPDDYSKDLPPWETVEPSIDALAAGESEVPVGPVQRYTWLSRAVLLGKSEDGMVRDILYAEGRALQDGPVPDPMAVTLSTPRGPFAMKLDVDRALWRDLDALVGDARGRPPLVIENAVSILANIGSYDPIDLMSGGLLADKAKLEMWRLEERRISPKVLGLSGEMTATVCNALGLAEKTGAALDSAIFQLAHEWLQRSMPPRKDDVRALFTQLGAMPGFWHRLEPVFWNFVQELEAAQTDEPFERWQSSVKDAVRHTWAAATMRLGASGRALEVAAKSEKFLWRALAASSSA